MKPITVTRKTTESFIEVTLSAFTPDYRSRINTPIAFLSHMLEHIAWRSGFNIETKVELDKFDLKHVIAEDLGQTLGKAVGKYVSDNMPIGYGDGIGIIDEAKACVCISFEGRGYLDFRAVSIPEIVEDSLSDDIKTFLEGFVHGAQCTLHVDIEKGSNGHHIWEAVYRGLGTALGNSLRITRSDMTAGVAGAIEFDIKG